MFPNPNFSQAESFPPPAPRTRCCKSSGRKCRSQSHHISLSKRTACLFILLQERDTAEVLNKKLRKQLAEYRVPPILDYVHEKMQVQELRNTIRIWERKVEIAEVGTFFFFLEEATPR